MHAALFMSLIVGLLTMTAAVIYVFGIPPKAKRVMEEKALETMGENKASYLVKGMWSLLLFGIWRLANVRPDQINKIPASDQKEVKDLKSGLGNAVGGVLQNPLGKEVGNVGDSLTSPLTGR